MFSSMSRGSMPLCFIATHKISLFIDTIESNIEKWINAFLATQKSQQLGLVH